jgi:hypothetical protein
MGRVSIEAMSLRLRIKSATWQVRDIVSYELGPLGRRARSWCWVSKEGANMHRSHAMHADVPLYKAGRGDYGRTTVMGLMREEAPCYHTKIMNC